jgi:hypothetical protein
VFDDFLEGRGGPKLMSVNLDLLLEPEIEDAHPESDIHLSLTYIDDLDDIAKRRKVQTLTSFIAEGGDDDEGEGDLTLFDAAKGLATTDGLLAELRTGKHAFTNAEEMQIIVEELEEVAQCLRKAADARARFCLVEV